MQLIEVNDKTTKQEFLLVPKKLYKNDPNWICPLDTEIENVFNPQRNRYFNEGEAIRWILKDDEGRLAGRVAAFYNDKRSKMFNPATGGIGFFECINNKEAAFMLFNTGKKWLETKGMGAMEGPVNFGENQNYWGCLVKGFMQQGIGMPYNFPYYQELFESFGFKNYYEQYSYHRYIPDKFPERFKKIASWAANRGGFEFKHFTYTDKDKYISDMAEIYNSAWAEMKVDFVPMDKETLNDALKGVKMILDEELIWFVYKDSNPAAFYIILPDVNQILKHLNGKINLWNILKFIYYKKIRTMNRARALVAGVAPKYQNSGIESCFFEILFEVLKHKPYKEIELSWVGDYNPKMLAFYEGIGAKAAKTHITYKYLFDRNLPFVRFADL